MQEKPLALDPTEKLRLWGATHAAARDAERAALHASVAPELHHRARELRAQADRLHAEVYRELGRPH